MKAKLKTDLTIVIILSIAVMGLIGESFLEKWEFWMAPLLFVGIVGAWFIHIVQYGTEKFRENYYLTFGMSASFFHGVHETSFFDIVVIYVLLMLTFSLLENAYYVTLIFIEYFVVMSIQLFLAFSSDAINFDALNISRVALHIAACVIAFLICRKVIQDRFTLREKLQQKNDEIESADFEMEDFLTNISHELRTPVNVVNGMSTLILQREDSDEVEAIKNAGVRMSYQIEDIQDYTEIDRGEVVLENENYRITSVVNDVVTGMGVLDIRGIPELVVDLDPSVPIIMFGDYKKIQKILRHLIDNAIKFTPQGGIYIRIMTYKRQYGVNLSIEVRDTGVGMSKKEIDKASKGFYQANKKRNRSTGGIGLGLNIVSGFVHEMDGFIKIESEPNLGTRVRVSIPQTVVDPRPCLSIEKDKLSNIIFYLDATRHAVGQVRDFYRYMASNLAGGFDCNLYPSTKIKDINRIMNQLDVSHIFMDEKEYLAHSSYFDEISKKDVIVAVATTNDLHKASDSKVVAMPSPLYGYTVSKVINEGYNIVENGIDEEQVRPRFDGVKVLVVDDEPMNLVVATGLFRDYGMIVDTADSGMEAIEKNNNESYDVIFMDHMMPEMDGMEAMKRIRSGTKGKQSAIVALTANAVSGSREMFINEGFDGFIAKPINIYDFERVMKRLLDESLISYDGGGR